MKLNKVVSTLEMPHEEWLRYRKKGIGGSDAGAERLLRMKASNQSYLSICRRL